MIVDNTPVEVHQIKGREILVKREDLCCPFPGPSFSKIRGVVAHIKARPEPVIGVLDTYHSKAGWAVAYVCQNLGKQAVDYWPRYKKDPENGLPRPQQQHARAMGSKMVAIKAGRSAILYHTARKHLTEKFPGESYLMPNALKLPESITENAAEAARTVPHLPEAGTLVLSISSGTVASGVLQGFQQAGVLDRWDVILHMGYARSIDACRAYMEKAAGLTLGDRVRFVDEGYGYADAAPESAAVPFPCNPYYDAKAWAYLQQPGVLDAIEGPVVFWNIGD